MHRSPHAWPKQTLDGEALVELITVITLLATVV